MDWTEERTDFIKTKFLEGGLSARQIAGLLGDVTREAVCGKLYRIGARRPRAKRIERPAPDTGRRRLPKSADGRPRNAGWKLFPTSELTEITTEIDLIATADHHCRWIIGKKDRAWYVCGKAKALAGAFCPHHAAIAYRPSGFTPRHK